MDPPNNARRSESINGLCSSSSLDTGALNNSANNNELLFSTLRNLATKNSEAAITTNGLCNATTSISSFPMALSDQNTTNCSPNTTSACISSSAWLDQAKFSLLPMYGMFHSSINPSEMYRNSNLPWMDSNIHQAAAAAVAFNAAASFNAMQSLPSLGHIGQMSTGLSNLGDDFQRPTDESKFEAPLNEGLKNSLQSPQCATIAFQRQNTSSCYSQSTASTAHTPQSTIGPPTQSQTMAMSPEEMQSGVAEFPNSRENPNVSTEIEELSELDLHDFEDFLLDKPSTSFQHSHQSHCQQNNFFTAEFGRITSVGKAAEYRSDELTSADIELDRLVSLVASQNNSRSTDSKPFASKKSEASNKNANPLGSDSIFELPKFTPPDSPISNPSTVEAFNVFGQPKTEHKEPLNICEETTESNKPNTGNPSMFDANLVLIPKEIKSEMTTNPSNLNKMSMARRNANKLPVYKQTTSSLQNKPSFLRQPRSDNDHQRPKQRNSDAYSFEDDELSAVPASCSLSEVLQSTKRSSEGREFKLGKDEDSKTAKRKYARQNPLVVPTVPNVKVAEKTNTVNSILMERMRLKARTLFVSSEIANDDHSVLTDIPIPTCTVRSISSNENDCSKSPVHTPLLPKLVIRFPKREISSNDEQPTQKHSSHKKRKKRDKDIDWTETKEWHGAKTKDRHRKEKKHKKPHHKRRKHSVEAEESDFTLPCSSASIDHNSTVFNELHSKVSDHENAEFLTRLHLFERPTERPRRGTFLLPKDAVFDSDCALWRIDNQNLLQKYLPMTLDGVKCYHNSSTYSGWCEHYVDEYISVKVEYVKQSRSENIVRPIVPLQDLFPATNFFADDEEKNDCQITRNGEPSRNFSSAVDQQFWNSLVIFTKMMLKHSVSLQFMQHVRQNNDWTYLCALTEIESAIGCCVQKIRNNTPFWPTKFVDNLQLYPRINSIGLLDDNYSSNRCQVCSSGDRDVSSAIQLFSLDEQYDHETLTPISPSNCEAISSSNQATDFYVCASCEHFALSYHKAYHLCFTVLKSAEEKLELFSTRYPELLIDELISKCLEDKIWLNKIAAAVHSVSKEGLSEK